MKSSLVRLFTTALVLISSVSFGQEWPRFRGPNGVGTSEAATVPESWTPEDYNWRVELPGIGYSSPVIFGDRVFVTCGLEEDATQIVRCLKTADGGLIWERSFPSVTHARHDFNCYASSTPALDGQFVYFAWAAPDRLILVKLDQENGGELWRRDFGPFVAEHAFGASPMLFDGMVILPNEQDGDSSIIAIDCDTGKTRWTAKRRTEKAAYATPCIYRAADGKPQLIVNSWAHGVSSLDPHTGQSNWEQAIFKYRVVGSPVICAGLIFGYGGSGGVGRQMFAVSPPDPETGRAAKVAYEIKGSLPYVCTPVTHGDLLFSWFDRGVVTCLDAPTGKVHWQERIGGDYFCSPIRVKNRLYCISRKGEMVVLAASKQFEELARIDLEEPSNSTPAVADGVMYIRTNSHLMSIGGDG